MREPGEPDGETDTNEGAQTPQSHAARIWTGAAGSCDEAPSSMCAAGGQGLPTSASCLSGRTLSRCRGNVPQCKGGGQSPHQILQGRAGAGRFEGGALARGAEEGRRAAGAAPARAGTDGPHPTPRPRAATSPTNPVCPGLRLFLYGRTAPPSREADAPQRLENAAHLPRPC